MKVLLITNPGLEEVSKKEVNEILEIPLANIKNIYGGVIFEVKKLLDIVYVCYLCKSARRILYLFGEFNEKTSFEKEFIDFFEDDISIAVRVEKNNEIDIDGQNIERKVADSIFEFLESNKKNAKVDLKNPELPIIAFCSDKIYLGIDFAGFDLSSRPYRIFNNPRELKSNICYGILRLAGFNGNEKTAIIDCLSGTIAIEAGLYSLFKSPFYSIKESFAFNNFTIINIADVAKIMQFLDSKQSEIKIDIFALSDDTRSINATNKNSKIASIANSINISKIDVDWLDTKFNKNFLDILIVQRVNNYKEIFEKAKFVLNKKATLAIILNSSKDTEELKKISKDFEFKFEKAHIIKSGKADIILELYKRLS